MRPISQRALAGAYLRNDAQLDGAELAALIRANKRTTVDPSVSAQVVAFANPLDRQVISLVRGEIPGADVLLTKSHRAALRQQIDLANDPAYAAGFADKIDAATGVPSSQGNDLKFLVDGPEVYPEIRRLIGTAKQTLDMEFYALQPDATGQGIVDDMLAAAKRGVRINLLLDLTMAIPAKKLIAQLKAGGVNVRTYTGGYDKPLLHLDKLVDHRKLILVDGKEGMTGGMNLGEPYEKYWHDTMSLVRGPILKDIYKEFAGNWTQSGGKRPVDALALAAVRAKPAGTYRAAMHLTTPTRHEIATSFNTAIEQAKDHIFISSPYFIDEDMIGRLTAAAKRGVKVVAVIPNVTDVTVVDRINEFRIKEMLAAGVEVRSYDSTNPDLVEVDFMKIHLNHAKLLTVDGVWSSVGTANLDNRALSKNQEINVAVSSPVFARDIERRFFNKDAIGGRISPAVAKQYSPLTMALRRKIVAKISPLL